MMDESYDKSGPPPTYDDGSGSQSQRTTTTTSTSEGLHLNRDYITTIPAILKYAEAVGSLICMISASLYVGGAAVWCGCTAGTALYTVIIWYFFYLFNVVSKFPSSWYALFELIYYIVIAVCYLILSILAAATAAGLSAAGAGFGVYAFFGFVTLGVFCVDIFFQFKKWRSEGHTQTHTQTTTTTTTTGGSSVI